MCDLQIVGEWCECDSKKLNGKKERKKEREVSTIKTNAKSSGSISVCTRKYIKSTIAKSKLTFTFLSHLLSRLVPFYVLLPTRKKMGNQF